MNRLWKWERLPAVLVVIVLGGAFLVTILFTAPLKGAEPASPLHGTSVTVSAAASTAYGDVYDLRPMFRLNSHRGEATLTGRYTSYYDGVWTGLIDGELSTHENEESKWGAALKLRAVHANPLVLSHQEEEPLSFARVEGEGFYKLGSALKLNAAAGIEMYEAGQHVHAEAGTEWQWLPWTTVVTKLGGNTSGDATTQLGLKTLITPRLSAGVWASYAYIEPISALDRVGGQIAVNWRMRPSEPGPSFNVTASRRALRWAETPVQRENIEFRGSVPLLDARLTPSVGLIMDWTTYYNSTEAIRNDQRFTTYGEVAWRITDHIRINARGEATDRTSDVPANDLVDRRVGLGATATF